MAIEVSVNPKRAIRAPRHDDQLEPGVLGDLDLPHLLRLQEAFRRLYPPFFAQRSEAEIPETLGKDVVTLLKGFPVAWRWIDNNGKISRTFGTRGDKDPAQRWFADFNQTDADRPRAIPMANVFRTLLIPIFADGDSEQQLSDPNWHQLGDERMPSMLYLCMPGAGRLSGGEWARLCFMDGPPVKYDQTKGPMGHAYSTCFMRGFLKRHAYDRWWFGSFGTRYLFSSYSFLTVGTPAKDRSKDKPFFEVNIQRHFRRQYFQLGLLTTLQHTALSALSSWTASAVEDAKHDKTRLRRRLSQLHERFLSFSHRFWFGVVSNQLQPREMYEQWQREIGTPKLYAEVKEQLGEAASFLETMEQSANTDAATRLSVIATLAALVGLPATTFSLFDEGLFFHKFKDAFWLADAWMFLAAIGIAAVSVLALMATLGLKHSPSGKSGPFNRLKWLLRGVFAVGAVAAALRVSCGLLPVPGATDPKRESFARHCACDWHASGKITGKPQVKPDVPPSGDKK